MRALTVWQMKHTVTSTVQAAKEWQQQLRLPTTPSASTCMTACMLHKKAKNKLKFVTLDKESNMSTLWQPEEFLRICSKEELAQKAQDMEVTIPVKKSQETRYNLDPEFFVVNCFWSRRPDGVAINESLQIVYFFEFKRSTDRDEGFLEVKEAEANEQHKIIIGSCSEVVRNLSKLPLCGGKPRIGCQKRLLPLARKA